MGIELIFVADGISPEMKRQSNLIKNSNFINNNNFQYSSNNNNQNLYSNPQYSQFYSESLELLKLFHPAISLIELKQGESEACCGQLSELNYVDYVITQDSDCLLFGAKKLLKNVQIQKFQTRAELFSMEIISKNLSLTKTKLILFALLTGSDYSSGVTGFGLKQAEALIKVCIENENANCLQQMRKLITKQITPEEWCKMNNIISSQIDMIFDQSNQQTVNYHSVNDSMAEDRGFIDYSSMTDSELNSCLSEFGLKPSSNRKNVIEKLNKIQTLKSKWEQYCTDLAKSTSKSSIKVKSKLMSEFAPDNDFKQNSNQKITLGSIVKHLTSIQHRYENISEFDSIINAYMSPHLEPPLHTIANQIKSNIVCLSRLNAPDMYGMIRFNGKLGFIKRETICSAFEQLRRTQYLINFKTNSDSTNQQTGHFESFDLSNAKTVAICSINSPLSNVCIVGKVIRKSQTYYKLQWQADSRHTITMNDNQNSQLTHNNVQSKGDNFNDLQSVENCSDSVSEFEDENISLENSNFIEHYAPQLVREYEMRIEIENENRKKQRLNAKKIEKEHKIPIKRKAKIKQTKISYTSSQQSKLTHHFKVTKNAINESDNPKLNLMDKEKSAGTISRRS